MVPPQAALLRPGGARPVIQRSQGVPPGIPPGIPPGMVGRPGMAPRPAMAPGGRAIRPVPGRPTMPAQLQMQIEQQTQRIGMVGGRPAAIRAGPGPVMQQQQRPPHNAWAAVMQAPIMNAPRPSPAVGFGAQAAYGVYARAGRQAAGVYR